MPTDGDHVTALAVKLPVAVNVVSLVAPVVGVCTPVMAAVVMGVIAAVAGTVMVTLLHKLCGGTGPATASPVRVNVTVKSVALVPGTVTGTVIVSPLTVAAKDAEPDTSVPLAVIVADVYIRPGRVTTTLRVMLPLSSVVFHAAPPFGWGAVIWLVIRLANVVNTADGLVVTARLVVLVTREVAGIDISIGIALCVYHAAPPMAMVTWVSLFLVAVCVIPVGGLVIHVVGLVRVAANVSFASVITTLPPALPMVTLPMVADAALATRKVTTGEPA